MKAALIWICAKTETWAEKVKSWLAKGVENSIKEQIALPVWLITRR
ncbi:hypothetical protein [Holospora undulata]|uniref:Uncharacterized protein n=1 Tax=Holospora undulata HU1 TaxID=1321371 RepID=A0A061JI92_9PROT|nr:hypothetical protein [Holospora undulata]ETZ05317.1 hypothetical protein K737_300253 [Holospora undulata HU1]